MATHSEGPQCPGCDAKAEDCNQVMQDWFYRKKAKHPEMHLAWGFRDQPTQDEMFSEHKTMKKWPQSKHNVMVEKMSGKVPCAEAMDVFQIIGGQAIFSPSFYNQLHQEDVTEQNPIAWAGLWVTFKETDHFEIDHSKLGPA